MAFAPNSSIWLCTVPFDNTYKNQVRFSSAQAQASYFATQTKKTFSEYVVVRKTLPDGGVRSSVKVEANIDDLYGYNYMFYRNANHGTRNFYCFITDLIYVNEGTTEILFETDVYQTWLFDVQLLESFVVREHSETDEIGDNVIGEPFSVDDYIINRFSVSEELGQWGYLIASTEPPRDGMPGHDGAMTVNRGNKQSGIYQGLYFYFYTNPVDINTFMKVLDEVADGVESIVSITAIPKFSVAHANLGKDNVGVGYVASTDYPNSKEVVINMDSAIGTYLPRNNKLYTYPYRKLTVTNHDGAVVDYRIEDFADSNNIKFMLYGDVSVSPSLCLVPYNYKGTVLNVDYAISITQFPQCSMNSDAFKMWFAKNITTNATNGLLNIGKIVAGSAMVATGAGSLMGGGLIASGATGIMSQINSAYKASTDNNPAYVGAPKNNLLTAMEENKFDVELRMIRKEYAKMVDDYFTMYGYQTNRVKIPNTFSRPKFNYVQTIDVNIAPLTGGIPCDDMVRLKKVYNDGVTLWASTATVGDYSVDNSPK